MNYGLVVCDNGRDERSAGTAALHAVSQLWLRGNATAPRRHSGRLLPLSQLRPHVARCATAVSRCADTRPEATTPAGRSRKAVTGRAQLVLGLSRRVSLPLCETAQLAARMDEKRIGNAASGSRQLCPFCGAPDAHAPLRTSLCVYLCVARNAIRSGVCQSDEPCRARLITPACSDLIRPAEQDSFSSQSGCPHRCPPVRTQPGGSRHLRPESPAQHRPCTWLLGGGHMRLAGLFPVLLGFIIPTTAAAQGRRGDSYGIPPGHLPPPGECRVWYHGRPPGQQSPPTDCRTAEWIARRDPYARVIYGGDRERGYWERADRGDWEGDDRRGRGRAVPRRSPDVGYPPYPERYPQRSPYPHGYPSGRHGYEHPA